MARRTKSEGYSYSRTGIILGRERDGRYAVIQIDRENSRVVRRRADGTAEPGPGELVPTSDVSDIRATYLVPPGQRRTITLPLELCRNLGVEEAPMLEILEEDGGFRVRPLAHLPQTQPTLAELLAGITPENLHAEIDLGPPVGREVL